MENELSAYGSADQIAEWQNDKLAREIEPEVKNQTAPVDEVTDHL